MQDPLYVCLVSIDSTGFCILCMILYIWALYLLVDNAVLLWKLSDSLVITTGEDEENKETWTVFKMLRYILGVTTTAPPLQPS